MGKILESAMLLAITTVSITVMAATFYGIAVSHSGTIFQLAPNLEIFEDQACTKIATNILWGELHPGDTTTKTVYLKNTGAVNVTVVCFFGGWNPSSAQTYLVPSWNADGVVIAPGGVKEVVFKLVVLPTITGITTFNFIATINYSG